MNEYKQILADREFRELLAHIVETAVDRAINAVGKKPEDEYPELMSLNQTKKFLRMNENLFKAIRNGDLWPVTVQGKPKFRKSDLLLFNLHGTARVNGNKPPRNANQTFTKSRVCKSTRSLYSAITEISKK
jgi:hypothetical protein